MKSSSWSHKEIRKKAFWTELKSLLQKKMSADLVLLKIEIVRLD